MTKTTLPKTIILSSRFPLCVQSTLISIFNSFVANNNLYNLSKDSLCELKRWLNTFYFATHASSHDILYFQCNFISSGMLATDIERLFITMVDVVLAIKFTLSLW